MTHATADGDWFNQATGNCDCLRAAAHRSAGPTHLQTGIHCTQIFVTDGRTDELGILVVGFAKPLIQIAGPKNIEHNEKYVILFHKYVRANIRLVRGFCL